LPEFVRVVEQELLLDIELAANPSRVAPMANLNAFANVVSNYSANHNATLGGFLEWLDYAAAKENFDTPSISAAPGVVQVISVHSAKGLEWDVVAVPMLVSGTFPSTTGGNTGWLAMGELPYPLRGDSASLPQLPLESATKQTEVDDLVDVFKRNDVAEYRLREERRLVYVAVTRTKGALLVSGAAWKPGVANPAKPSVFLEEMNRFLGLGDLADFSEETENPDDKSELVEIWPLEPLGPKHRPKVERAAEATREAIAAPSPSAIDAEIDLLLADQDENIRRANQARLPVRIPASKFKDFLLDTDTVAEDYRRPMPREPFAATMAGTLFHAWVESRFGVFSVSDEIDQLPESEEPVNEALDINELKAIFEQSRFASMTPVDVECEIQVTVRENTFICKIDAVFKTETGYEIVDWKTGVSPKTDKEIAEKALQLALYRMAYAKFHNIDPDQIEVCLYYVNEDIEIKPEAVKSSEELLAMWSAVLESVGD
jgi:DNA helicase-2/ATP-dependent DNA helicase PcrA